MTLAHLWKPRPVHIICSQMSSYFSLLWRKNECQSFYIEDEKDYPDYHQSKMEKPAMVLKWICAIGTGDLNMSAGAVDTEVYTWRHIQGATVKETGFPQEILCSSVPQCQTSFWKTHISVASWTESARVWLSLEKTWTLRKLPNFSEGRICKCTM